MAAAAVEVVVEKRRWVDEGTHEERAAKRAVMAPVDEKKVVEEEEEPFIFLPELAARYGPMMADCVVPVKTVPRVVSRLQTAASRAILGPWLLAGSADREGMTDDQKAAIFAYTDTDFEMQWRMADMKPKSADEIAAPLASRDAWEKHVGAFPCRDAIVDGVLPTSGRSFRVGDRDQFPTVYDGYMHRLRTMFVLWRQPVGLATSYVPAGAILFEGQGKYERDIVDCVSQLRVGADYERRRMSSWTWNPTTACSFTNGGGIVCVGHFSAESNVVAFRNGGLECEIMIQPMIYLRCRSIAPAPAAGDTIPYTHVDSPYRAWASRLALRLIEFDVFSCKPPPLSVIPTPLD
jgi:hypothetical protein